MLEEEDEKEERGGSVEEGERQRERKLEEGEEEEKKAGAQGWAGGEMRCQAETVGKTAETHKSHYKYKRPKFAFETQLLRFQ